VLVPFLVLTMAAGGRTWLLRQNFEVSDSSEPRLRWSLMSKALIEERDQYLVKALTKIDKERRNEAIDVGVVYGAAHFPPSCGCCMTGWATTPNVVATG